MKLPKNNISVNEVDLWLTDKLKFMKNYFMGIKDNLNSNLMNDIKDYHNNIEREYKFPPKFIEDTKFLPLIDYEIENQFDGFILECNINNISDDFKTIIQFEMDVPKLKQKYLDDNLKLQLYSLIILETKGVIPTCVVDYYGIDYMYNTIIWNGYHEKLSVTFSHEKLMETKNILNNIIKEISVLYELYCNDNLNDLMENYAELLIKEKENKKQQDLLKVDIEKILKDNSYIKRFRNKIITYSTFVDKKFVFSNKVHIFEKELEQIKKKEIENGDAIQIDRKKSLIYIRTIK
jgi:hypothetical protein